MNSRGNFIIIFLFAAGCQGQNEPAPKTHGDPPGAVSQERGNERENEIRRYVKRLESKNGNICLDAVDYLPYFGKDAVPALIEALKSPSSNQRALAAATLARIPDGRAVAPLIAHLEDKGTLELNVLSDDGLELHGAYDNPLPDFVKQQTQAALVAVTGRHFAKKADWEAWWQKNQDSFTPKEREPKRDRCPIPPTARYLKDVKICLDPGHGGDTHKRGFKRGPTYVSEAEMNLRVARFLRDFLVSQGAIVTMTRDSDVDITLKDRALSSAGCDFFVSVHHNWSPNLTSETTGVWYHLTPDHQPAALDLARYIETEVLATLDFNESPRGGGLMSDGLMYKEGFGVLRDLPPDVPGCLCETTYYSNLSMERKLRDIEFNRNEAYGIFLGIAKYVYFGIPRAEVAKADTKGITFRVFDGLEDRHEWSKPFKILSEHIVVRVDGQKVEHAYANGVIAVVRDLAVGEHAAQVELINVHKNNSWPKRLSFTVK